MFFHDFWTTRATSSKQNKVRRWPQRERVVIFPIYVYGLVPGLIKFDYRLCLGCILMVSALSFVGLLALLQTTRAAFYLPGVAPKTYSTRDKVSVS